MHIRTLPFAAALCALSSAPGAAFAMSDGEVRIELRPDVATRAAQVRLGDIAIVHTGDFPTIQRLVSLPLGQAPRAGEESVVRRDAIARWVRSQLGIGSDRVLWVGPDETVVRSLAQEFPAARLEQEADAALREWLAQRASRYVAQALPVSGDLRLPAGHVELKARPLADNAEPASRMVVWMDVRVDGRFVRAIPVSFNVDAYRQAWVAPVAIPSGVGLAPDMLERREVNMTRRPEGTSATGAPRQEAPPDRWRTTKAVAPGEAITVRNAAAAPMVGRGEWVLLRLKSGLVELESRAQAIQQGDLGQTVQVRSSGGSAPLAARVVAPGQVEATL